MMEKESNETVEYDIEIPKSVLSGGKVIMAFGQISSCPLPHPHLGVAET